MSCVSLETGLAVDSAFTSLKDIPSTMLFTRQNHDVYQEAILGRYVRKSVGWRVIPCGLPG